MVAERAAAPPPFSEYLILVVAAAMIPLAWGAGRLSLRYGASARLEPVHERAH
jgi:hypothetical protein